MYFSAEDYEQAEESFKLGLTHDPDDERCTEAIKDMKKNTIKQKVRNAVARGRQAFEKGDYVLAIDYFNDAIEKNPKNCTYYVYLPHAIAYDNCRSYRSIANSALKKGADALEDATKITQLQPNWPKVPMLTTC